MAANVMQGMIRFHLGDTALARQHLSAVVDLYRPEAHAALYPRYLMDFGVFGRFYLALSLARSNEADAAAALALQAVALAEQLGQPRSMGFSLLADLSSP